MIVVLSYYSDGGTPVLRFFPTGKSQAMDLAAYMAALANSSQEIRVYWIDSLDAPAVEVEREIMTY